MNLDTSDVRNVRRMFKIQLSDTQENQIKSRVVSRIKRCLHNIIPHPVVDLLKIHQYSGTIAPQIDNNCSQIDHFYVYWTTGCGIFKSLLFFLFFRVSKCWLFSAFRIFARTFQCSHIKIQISQRIFDGFWIFLVFWQGSASIFATAFKNIFRKCEIIDET